MGSIFQALNAQQEGYFGIESLLPESYECRVNEQ